MTRNLTSQEIENILDFIVPCIGIPEETSKAIVESNKERFRVQLREQKVYPEIIPLLKEELKKAYRTTLIQPGESVGILCAQSIGEKNTQLTLNSVDWSEKLLYTKNGKAIVEPIGQMIDRHLKETPKNIIYIEENRTQYLSLQDNYYIPSCDKNGICNWYKIEAITKHLPIGKLVKVITQSGRSVIATQSKSFLVWDGIQFADTLGSDIKIGDILPTTYMLVKPKTIQLYFEMENIFPKDKYLYSTELVKARKYKQSKEFDWQTNHYEKNFILPYKCYDTNFEKINKYFINCKPGFIYMYHSDIPNTSNCFLPDKIFLDNEFGFLIGVYLAKGLSTLTFVCINNCNKIITQKIIDFCNKYGIIYHFVTNNNERKTSKNLKIHSILLAKMFKIICDTGSENKKIPEITYTAPNQFIKGLIDGYFSSIGLISKKYISINISSISENLITGISFLLSYFGIYCKIFNKKQLINKKIFTLQIRNSFLQQFAKEIYLTDIKKQDELQKIILIKNYKSKNKFSQLNFPERNVYFDKIISIEYIDGTTDYVYDLTVEKTRNFQLWNGLNQADTFHKAGQSEKGITAGVPRFQELLNATKTPRLINCRVFFKEGNDTIQNLRNTINHTIVGLTFKDIAKSIKIVMEKEDEMWYESFKVLYNNNFTKYTNCISVKLNMNILFEYKLSMQDISDLISNEYDDISCVFSPPNIGQFDIFVDTSNISLPENRLLFIDTENAPLIYLEESVQPVIEKMLVCGIEGITNIYYMQEGNEWMVDTEGSNFKKLLAHPKVDMARVVSNNVWDIYEILGIEAARKFLIEEYTSIMEGITISHTKLLVERMTYSGTISSISRYTMRKDEAGPICKASFEESVDNFLKAAANGDVEPTNGVSASIICGKRANIGTGMMDLRVDIKRLPAAIPIIKNIIEETKPKKTKLKKKLNKEDNNFSKL